MKRVRGREHLTRNKRGAHWGKPQCVLGSLTHKKSSYGTKRSEVHPAELLLTPVADYVLCYDSIIKDLKPTAAPIPGPVVY